MVDYNIYLNKRNRTFSPSDTDKIDAFMHMFEKEGLKTEDDKIAMYNSLEDFYSKLIGSKATEADIVPIMHFISNVGDQSKLFVTKTLAKTFADFLRMTHAGIAGSHIIYLCKNVISSKDMLTAILSVLKYTDKSMFKIVQEIMTIGIATGIPAETRNNLEYWLVFEETIKTDIQFVNNMRHRIRLI